MPRNILTSSIRKSHRQKFVRLTVFKASSLLLVLFAFASNVSAQEKIAFLVGAETYDTGTFKNLKYAEDDAIELGKVLRSLGYKTTVMTSQAPDVKLKPYKASNILKALKGRIATMDELDTLIVSFSGHGVQFADEELFEGGIRETYFCPEGADLADKSTLVPISQVVKLVEDCKAKRKLLLVDSCRDEFLSDAGSKGTAMKLDLGQVHQSPRIYSEGMAVLFSCSSKQRSWEHDELGHSVFTNYVIDYFKGNARADLYENGSYKLNDLVHHVVKKTNNFVIEKHLAVEGQHPVLSGTSASWPLGKLQPLESYAGVSLELVNKHIELDLVEAVFEMGERAREGRDGVSKNYDDALKWYMKAAEDGFAEAQYRIGYLYDYGYGVDVDYEQAFKWYSKALAQGHPTAHAAMGWLYINGQGVVADEAKALDYFRKAVDLDDAEGYQGLGYLYQMGSGIEQDHAKAIELYKTSAEMGYAEANASVGWMYIEGNGVSVDENEGIKWFRKAAELDAAGGFFGLGYVYEHGLGVNENEYKAFRNYEIAAEKAPGLYGTTYGNCLVNGFGTDIDYKKAMKYYRLAAAHRDGEALYSIGWMYDLGHGVDIDDKEALKWYLQAAERQFEPVYSDIGWMYINGEGVEVDYKEAYKWFKKGAQTDEPAAGFYGLAYMHESEQDVESNPELSFEYYLKAAKLDYTFAKLQAGHCYFAGYGTDVDYDEAINWYVKAADDGDAEAQRCIGIMYLEGHGVKPNTATAISWFRKASKNGDEEASELLKQYDK